MRIGTRAGVLALYLAVAGCASGPLTLNVAGMGLKTTGTSASAVPTMAQSPAAGNQAGYLEPAAGQQQPSGGQMPPNGQPPATGQPQAQATGAPAAAQSPAAKPEATAAPAVDAAVPDVYKRIYGAYSIKVVGDNVVLESKGTPDHDSPYYSGDSYAPDNDPAFRISPNAIVADDLTLTIPLHPAEASSHTATQGGPTGMALDGVPFFNQYNGQNSPLSSEIVSFDQYNGHPNQDGEYHYHVEPLYLTTKYGKDALLGFMLDGFPVYGPMEGGKTLASADLDTYHGHFGATADYPNGIYHYHITADAPYITGTGYYGTPGKAVTAIGPGSQGGQQGGQQQGGQQPSQQGGQQGGQTGSQQPPQQGGQTGQQPPQGGQTGQQPPPQGGQNGQPPPPPQGGQQPPPRQ